MHRDLPEGTAKCSRCREVKPLDEFKRNRSRKNGRSTYCSLCSRQIANERNRVMSAIRGMSELTRVRHAIAALQMREATLIEELEIRRLKANRNPEKYARDLIAKGIANAIPKDAIAKKIEQLELLRMSRSLKSAATKESKEPHEAISQHP